MSYERVWIDSQNIRKKPKLYYFSQLISKKCHHASGVDQCSCKGQSGFTKNIRISFDFVCIRVKSIILNNFLCFGKFAWPQRLSVSPAMINFWPKAETIELTLEIKCIKKCNKIKDSYHNLAEIFNLKMLSFLESLNLHKSEGRFAVVLCCIRNS